MVLPNRKEFFVNKPNILLRLDIAPLLCYTKTGNMPNRKHLLEALTKTKETVIGEQL